MQIIKVILLASFCMLSSSVFASDCTKCNEGLNHDRVELEQLIVKLKRFGVDAKSNTRIEGSHSRLAEQVVLESKIMHFKNQLNELQEKTLYYHHQ